MDYQTVNDPYKLKLSELRSLVSQDLVTVSGMLKDTTTLLKNYLELPTKNQEKNLCNSILKTGECLDQLNKIAQVMNKRIEHIVKNFSSKKEEEIEAINTLSQDVTKNTKGMSLLKNHYLEIVGLYTKDEKTQKQLTDLDCFKNESDEIAILVEKPTEQIISKKTKTKKKRWSLT